MRKTAIRTTRRTRRRRRRKKTNSKNLKKTNTKSRGGTTNRMEIANFAPLFLAC